MTEATLPLVEELGENEVSYEEICSRKDEYNIWNFDVERDVPEEERPNAFVMSGYESYEDELRKYSSKDFFDQDEEGRARIIDEVTDIYEKVGIFPIKYFSDAGVQNEVLKCFNSNAQFKNQNIVANSFQGASLCSWRFPSLWSTPSAQDDNGSAYEKFYRRSELRKIVSFNFNYHTDNPSGTPGLNILSGVRMTGSTPTNFLPMNAQAIFERFTPENGVIWDPCTGFGGRMLGVLSSRKNFKYVGTDPSTEVMYNLHKLAEDIVYTLDGELNDDGTPYDPEGRYELHCMGAEEIDIPDNSIDFVFTSPPYADLELYSNDGKDFNAKNQSTNKFPGLDQWMEGFVRGVVKKIASALKPGAYCAINIADFTIHGRDVHYVDDWTRISEEEGLTRMRGQQIYLGVRARSGSKLLGAGDSMKKENILVFQKPSNRRRRLS